MGRHLKPRDLLQAWPCQTTWHQMPVLRLYTVPTSAPEWTDLEPSPDIANADSGALWRVQPPGDATDVQIAAVVGMLPEPSAVRVDSRASADRVVLIAVPDLSAGLTPRARIMDRADALKNPQDLKALRQILTEVCDLVGL